MLAFLRRRSLQGTARLPAVPLAICGGGTSAESREDRKDASAR